MSSEGIRKFTFRDEPGDEPFELTTDIIPEWLDVNHPKFPKYFAMEKFNSDGVAVVWWLRLPPGHATGF